MSEITGGSLEILFFAVGWTVLTTIGGIVLVLFEDWNEKKNIRESNRKEIEKINIRRLTNKEVNEE